MAQKGEEQPAEYAGTRKKQWHYSQRQRIFREFEFYSLRKLRDPTVGLSQLWSKLLEQGSSEYWLHLVTAEH